ncbi:hypothetical protein CEP52_017024 [Fusarium oligoseptatum]|uniref:Uncharacterized protein n=1 Tax=Fusarium oligoseptatum TaxID=2604345 RepID=A0A428RXI9_9HYPO|nr:hypothetical protein CEP52_017024 [Fusarium oligoseptatum]
MSQAFSPPSPWPMLWLIWAGSFYFINASWNFAFLIIAYFTFVETKGLELEEINTRFEGSVILDGVIEDTASQKSDTGVRKNEGIADNA